jgi:cytoskeletal protein RodZ
MKKTWISDIKEVRKIKNLSLEEASKVINVPVAFLKNLEKEKFKELPPAVFTKFHIRKYFDLLEVNADECLKDYENYISRKRKKMKIKILKKEKPLNLKILITIF